MKIPRLTRAVIPALFLVGMGMFFAAENVYATSITLSEVGVKDSITVNAYFGGAIHSNVYGALAGYYQLSINGATAVNGFCVDPAWAPSNKAQSYDLRSIDPVNDVKYAKAAFLFSLADSNQYSAGLIQLAIWETVMVDDFTLLGSSLYPSSSYSKYHTDVDKLVSLAAQNYQSIDLSQYMLAVNDGLNNLGSGYGCGWQDYIVHNPNAAAPVPEPATMLLLGSGLVGVAAFRRRAKK